MVLLVNLQTGRTMEIDRDVVRERGLPSGWSDAASLSPEQWIEALRTALRKAPELPFAGWP